MVFRLLHFLFRFGGKYILLLTILLSTFHQLAAQCPVTAATPFDPARGGTTTTSGAIINSQPGALWVQDGGLDNSDGGALEIQGDVYINGDLRLSNNTDIVIQSSGRLFVYGNVYVNSGSTLTVNSGGNFYFYGEEWINEPGAVINNTSGEGAIAFIMPRPAPGAIDPVSGSARYPDNATAYTATGNAAQYVDGGGVDMDLNITHYNPNNISLCNLDNSAAAGSGNLRLSGTVSFSVAEGDVLLNDNSFILGATDNYTHNTINAYDGYFVTNGTGILSKEGLADNEAFTFATGQAENDYTPATVTNTSGTVNNYHVQVKTYANSGSTESLPTEGVDRTWQVYATITGTADICLQHNSATNPAGTGTDGSLFANTMAFVTQQASAGTWSTGTQTNGGSPLSTHCAVYTLPATVADATGYFSKASDPLTPLPVTLASFRGSVVNCTGRLTWKTASENNSRKFIVEHSINPIDFRPVGEVNSQNSINGAGYEYNYDAIQPGVNYFRLVMVDKDDRFEYSSVISFRSDCDAKIIIAPNPVKDVLTIRGLKTSHEVVVLNAGGQQMIRTRSKGNLLHIDTKGWTKGIYMVSVIENGKRVKVEKVLKD